MANIPLSEGFSIIPEGTYVFQITDVVYKEAFGKLEVKMKTAKGQTHVEKFSLMNKDKTSNQGAYNAFSFFAKTAMNDFSLPNIEHTALIGRFIKCDVEHDVQPNKNKPGQMVTFVRLGNKAPADGFDTAVPASAAPVETPKTAAPASATGKSGFDLKALLGR